MPMVIDFVWTDDNKKRHIAQVFIERAERIILLGDKFPNGRQFSMEDHLCQIREASPLIVAAYQSLEAGTDNSPLKAEPGQDYEEDRKKLLPRVYYLARAVEKMAEPLPISRVFGNRGSSSQESSLIECLAIAITGRIRYLTNPPILDQRLLDDQLFFGTNGMLYAVQLRDPKLGCSASLCSNCMEPVAFCDTECDNCKYKFVGPFGSPSINEWQRMDHESKQKQFKKLYLDPNYGRLNHCKRDK